MQTSALYKRNTIIAILILQFIPLILFPLSSFSPTSQEWWLPMLLFIFSLIATFQLVFRYTGANGPWDLVGFSQGFNIISRLMMLMPHAMINVGGTPRFNSLYVSLSIISMLLSSFVLWYIGKPETRSGIFRD
jgi:hypothetical protein